MTIQSGGGPGGPAVEAIPVVFDSAIEGFVRTYSERLTPAIKDEVRALGINLDNIVAAYPLEVFERAMGRAGQLLYPDMGDSERTVFMGREFVQGYVQTTLGKAALMMAKVVGPKRTLERVTRTFKTTANFSSADVKIHSDTHVELRVWMLPEFVPRFRGKPSLFLDYRLGVLQGMAGLLGLPDGCVTLLEKNLEEQSARYAVRW